jgi:hypothetical protein
VPTVLKSGSFKLLEPSGPVQACTGIVLPFYIAMIKRVYLHFEMSVNCLSSSTETVKEVKVKETRYRPGVAQSFPGGLGS